MQAAAGTTLLPLEVWCLAMYFLPCHEAETFLFEVLGVSSFNTVSICLRDHVQRKARSWVRTQGSSDGVSVRIHISCFGGLKAPRWIRNIRIENEYVGGSVFLPKAGSKGMNLVCRRRVQHCRPQVSYEIC